MGSSNAVCFISNTPIVAGDKCLRITFKPCESDDDFETLLHYGRITDGYNRLQAVSKSAEYDYDMIATCNLGTYDDNQGLEELEECEFDDLAMWVHAWVLDLFDLKFSPDGTEKYITEFCDRLFSISNILCKDTVSSCLGGQGTDYDQLCSTLLLLDTTRVFLQERIKACEKDCKGGLKCFTPIWYKKL